MTAKDRAFKIFNKMNMVVGGGNYDAKEYALIAVDEILNLDIDNNVLDYWYWEEVKQEIYKL
jgi:hypothetical protein